MNHRWPTLAVSIAGAILTICSIILLLDLKIEADVYGLLGQDDEAVSRFNQLSEKTPGLEELLIVCDQEYLLDRPTLARIANLDGVTAHTRSYLDAGKSPVYGYSLSVDAADWHETQPIIDGTNAILRASSAACGLTGTPAVVFEMQSRVDHDLRVAIVLAVVLVSLLFSFVYRIGLLAFFMMIPVGLGIAWGLAAYSLIRHELTLLAATVPTLLIGVGVDHCIHMIQSCRYAMTHDRLPRNQAVMVAWQRLLRPITLASLTTAITFVALTRANLSGFVDLGWSGALVTLGVYVACMALLPIVLLYCPERWLERNVVFDVPIRRLAPWIARRGALLVTIFVALGVLASLSASHLEMLSDNNKLETGGLKSRDLQDRISAEHELSTSPLLLLFANPEDSYELLASDQRPVEINSIMAVADVDGLLQVHPAGNPFLRAEYDRTLVAIESWTRDEGLGEWQISGAPSLNSRIDELLDKDVPRVLPVAALAIFVVLVIGTRSLLLPCIILTPLFLALLWLGGLMSYFGIAISAVTIAIAPLVLGIGVDGGVHFISAWRRHHGELEEIFAETGLAIIVTVATSVAAFGTFVISESPSLIRFGSQASLALIFCLIVTLFILPTIARRFVPSTSDQ
ncbi:MAG: MMPL family transporter [Woeseiaceae bacterium]|nr:MMPL family transporter [Woeseiaceae bacterium]